MKNDVIIVHNARAMREGQDLHTAAAGNWLVGTHSAPHLKYLVSVTSGGTILGVFDVHGYHPVGGRRLAFDITPSDKKVAVALPTMHRPFIYKHSSEVFAGMPVHPRGGLADEPPTIDYCSACFLVHAGGCP